MNHAYVNIWDFFDPEMLRQRLNAEGIRLEENCLIDSPNALRQALKHPFGISDLGSGCVNISQGE